MELDKAINVLREWVAIDREMRGLREIDSDYDKYCEEKNKAVERVLGELEELRGIR